VGVDDDADCVEHVWELQGIHLSLVRGVEQEEACVRCGTARYVTDDLRNDPRRPKLPPTRPLLGE
jgi:hypothetical protein